MVVKLRHLARRLIFWFLTFWFYVFRLVPVKKNKIVFSSYDGKGYGGNGKYISNELLARNANLDIVWLSANPKDEFPVGVRPVKYKSLRSIYEQATAKVWVDNKRKKDYVRKRKGQYYIQAWHAGITIKKVEKDAEDKLPPIYVRWAKHDSKMADLFLAESEWTYDFYKSIFWYDGEIMKCGLPRQDVLFQGDKTVLDRVYKALNVSSEYKLLLYAPTFRNTLSEELSEYDLDWDALLDAMEARFGGKWLGMIRLHPNISKLAKKLKLSDRVISVTDYPDIQELLLASSCLITDYSSCIFEFGMTNQQGFIYAADYDSYIGERDVMLDCKKLPFPFAGDKQTLLENIQNFDEAAYQKDMHAFYHDFLRMYEGGNASKAVADRILEVMKG